MKNQATLTELKKQIEEFKTIISSSFGVEKTLFSKLLVEAENDLKLSNYKK
jgi:hypothetical protein